jgi:hypothetical protein
MDHPGEKWSQIWLEVKQESRIFLESCFVLATSREVLSKYGEFRHFPKNIVTCTFFPPKNSFKPFSLDFLGIPQLEIS